jgi:CrcB protein
MVWLVIGIGGGLGAMARHALNSALAGRYSTFPFGIFIVNALGCLLIGLIAGLVASSRDHMSEHMRTFLVVGVLGGFTTFSTFGLDTFTLLKGGHTTLALLNALGQVGVGLLAVWMGFSLGLWRL